MSKKNVLNVKNMNVSFKSHGQEVKAVFTQQLTLSCRPTRFMWKRVWEVPKCF